MFRKSVGQIFLLFVLHAAAQTLSAQNWTQWRGANRAGFTALAQQAAKPANWDAWQFLLGEWEGEGSGTPGQGVGGFRFSLDLQKRVLVRKNWANYPATDKQAAFSHEDLMVVYQEPGQPTRAVYF